MAAEEAMNFLFFSAQYLPTVGGVERYTAGLARRLAAGGHGVTIVTSQLPGLAESEVSDGIRVERVLSHRLMGGRFPAVKYFREKKRILKLIGQADFAVVQTRFYPLSLVAVRLCRKAGKKAIVIEHGTAYLLRDGITGLFGKAYEHAACSFVKRFCGDFYGVSLACCRWLENFGIHTEKTLYNSVDSRRIKAAAISGREGLMRRLPDTNGKFVVTFSARFIPEKGPLQLISAFGRLSKGRDDMLLVMAGDGPEAGKAREIRGENVIFAGRLPYDENMALLALGDVFCLPTFSEGFATTVLERTAAGTCVLTTPTGGSPELIISPEHGLLFENMDEDSIYKALKYAYENPRWRKEAAKKAYGVLLRKFTWEKTASKLESIAIVQTEQ